MSGALLDEGLPYRVLGNLGFWERLEVKDLLAFLRLAVNPCTDSMALDRIIAKPARAIGAKAKESLRKCAASSVASCGPWWKCSWCQFKSSQAGLHELRAAVVLMRNAARYLSIEAAVDVAMLGARYAAYCDDEGDRLERIDQLKRLCNTPSAWLAATATLDPDDSPSSLDDLNSLHSNSPGASDSSSSPCDPSLPMLRAFLEHAQLLHDDQPESSADSKGSKGRTKQDSGEKVQLMTLHSSKGMEYEVVFVLGLEEDLLPSSMHQNVQGALDEEKRLAYVGCTRAKQRLYLLTAQASPAAAIALPATAIALPPAPIALPAACATTTAGPADTTGLQQHVQPLLLSQLCLLHASPLLASSSCRERAIHGKRGDRQVSRFVSSILKVGKLAQRPFHVKWTHC
ncbi:DNA helicase [Haematococcus lacustris]|uniref:DNA helicase n=1 Tax=Haematococcus lacustris TaxID=44745 RepID=A0A699YMK5_HAELA|nr:DNA helicase [Haematococcus lacustris]